VSSRNSLSRRAFLKQSGVIAWFGPVFGATPPTSRPAVDLAFPELAGRAFTRTAIHADPDEAGAVFDHLLPDGVTPITGLTRDGCWVQVPGGYVRREAVQPIAPYSRPALVEAVGQGFWAEVVAPASAIREWCAGAAPVVARLGFGAVVYVVDRLTDDHDQVWYGLTGTPGSPLVGWAAALHYAPWNPGQPDPRTSSIHLLLQQNELAILDGARPIGQAATYGPRLPAGLTTLRAVQPGAPLDAVTPLGLPWLMRLGTGQRLYGAYWHNRFGAMSDGPDIELPTFAARWLHGWLASRGDAAQLPVECG
jgi:hypothetical protein